MKISVAATGVVGIAAVVGILASAVFASIPAANAGVTLDKSGTATAEIAPTSVVPSGLVGYWPFDGKDINWTANTTADVSGKGNTGTLVGMSTTTSPVMGKMGQAL